MAEVTRPGIVQGIPVSGPPPQFETRIPPYGVWSTGLCDCLDDLENCELSTFGHHPFPFILQEIISWWLRQVVLHFSALVSPSAGLQIFLARVFIVSIIYCESREGNNFEDFRIFLGFGQPADSVLGCTVFLRVSSDVHAVYLASIAWSWELHIYCRSLLARTFSSIAVANLALSVWSTGSSKTVALTWRLVSTDSPENIGHHLDYYWLPIIKPFVHHLLWYLWWPQWIISQVWTMKFNAEK